MTTFGDLTFGRLVLAAIEDPVAELLGSEVTTTGDVTAVGQRKPKGFTMNWIVHGFNVANPTQTGNRMRRQLRAAMQNPAYRLAGVYMMFAPDPERNGWLVVGEAGLAAPDGGVTFGSYKLTLDQAFKIASLVTHRDGYRVDLTDLRQIGSTLDLLGQVVNTSAGFAGLTPLSLSYAPVGATDLAVLNSPVTARGARSSSDGSCPLCAGLSSGDVLSWERPEGSFNKGDVIVYDRRGNLGPFSGASPYKTAVLADSPISYWRLDDATGVTAVDQMGVNPGTYHNTAGVLTGVTLGATGPLAEPDAAVTLDGTSGYMKVPYSASTHFSGAFTWEGWFFYTTGHDGCFFQAGGAWNHVLTIDGGTAITIAPGTGDLFFNAVAAPTTGWHHIVLAVDAASAILYIDGVAVFTHGVAGAPVASGADWYVGADLGTGGSYAGGYWGGGAPAGVDEVAVYNTKLSAGRIAAHYAAGVSSIGYDLVPLPGDIQTSYGWEEIYGPDYPYNWLTAGQPMDAPVLSNGLCRVRRDSGGTLVLDVWTGTAYAAQGQLLFEHRGGTNSYLDTLISATVIEWTPDRGVIMMVYSSTGQPAPGVRDRVFVTLQRGWTGPRIEIYPSGAGADASVEFSSTLTGIVNRSAVKIDAAGAANVSTAASGVATWTGQNVGTASFNGENEVACIQEGGGYQLTMAVVQPAAFAFVNGTDIGVYGTGGLGYISAQIGISAQVADQIMEAEALTLGAGTANTADGAASAGHAATATRTTDANAHVTRAAWPGGTPGKYRVTARVKTSAGTASVYAKTSGTTGATKTTTSGTYTILDLGDIVANGSTLEIHAWTTSGTVSVDRIEAVLLEDRTAAAPGYAGARDLGQAVLFDGRYQNSRRVTRG